MRYTNKAYSRNALAGLYRAARVGLVTPLRDGMNLVAKEYVAAQDAKDPGVLILSRFAGAAAEFDAALLINPYDPEAVGNAIARALSMPRDERVARHAKLYRALLDNDITEWGDRFLTALTGDVAEFSRGKDAMVAERHAADTAAGVTPARATKAGQSPPAGAVPPQAPAKARSRQPKASGRPPEDSR